MNLRGAASNLNEQFRQHRNFVSRFGNLQSPVQRTKDRSLRLHPLHREFSTPDFSPAWIRRAALAENRSSPSRAAISFLSFLFSLAVTPPYSLAMEVGTRIGSSNEGAIVNYPCCVSPLNK
jgi:hypothetical protein